MKKSIRSEYARVPDGLLTEGALHAALRVPTLSEVERRAARVLKSLREAGVNVRKQCTHNTRCGSLACMTCRRRAQLALLTVYAPPLFAAQRMKKRGGSR